MGGEPMAAPAAASPGVSAEDRPRDLQGLVFGLFFVFGGVTSLNDVLIPKLKALFALRYMEAMLVQSAFFAAYLTVSIPASAVVRRIGYMRSAVAGLLAMLAGCLLFVPAARSGQFPAFLAALFVLACGVTIVQVVANPLISMLGDARTAHSRLTFAQAFNSLGTTVFPYVASVLVLGAIAHQPAGLSGTRLQAYRAQESDTIARVYLGLAAVLGVLAGAVWLRRKRLVEAPAERSRLLQGLDLLRRPRFAFGVLCIFLYVGAEVAIGSLIVNYLMQGKVLGLSAEAAGKRIPFYWGGALVGRFAGAYALRRISPGKLLAAAAAGAIGLLLVSGVSAGALAGYALLAVGLCNSIMFPTIFSLTSEGLGRRAAEGSGITCIAIVGGAVVPLAAGHAADLFGLRPALAVPALCYLAIAGFGLFARRPLSGAAA